MGTGTVFCLALLVGVIGLLDEIHPNRLLEIPTSGVVLGLVFLIFKFWLSLLRLPRTGCLILFGKTIDYNQSLVGLIFVSYIILHDVECLFVWWMAVKMCTCCTLAHASLKNTDAVMASHRQDDVDNNGDPQQVVMD